MIYPLGNTGYVGQSCQALLTRKGIPFCSLSREELDYSNPVLRTETMRGNRLEGLISSLDITVKCLLSVSALLALLSHFPRVTNFACGNVMD